MKKLTIYLLILLTVNLFSFSLAETPATIDDSQVQDIQNQIDRIPIDDSGNIDPSKLGLNSTKAEERIAAINQWLDKNASWLRIIFGIRPEFSWVFLLDFIIIINLFVYFNDILILGSTLSEKTSLWISILITIVAIQIGVTVKIAAWLIGIWGLWWVKIIIVLIFVGTMGFSKLLLNMGKERRRKAEEEKERVNREKLRMNVNSAEKFTKSISDGMSDP